MCLAVGMGLASVTVILATVFFATSLKVRTTYEFN